MKSNQREAFFSVGKKIDEPMCDTCEHFRRHYVEVGDRFIACFGGHCLAGYLKHRKPWDVCVNYIRKSDEK